MIFRSSVGTMFALPWFLTWFGHSLNRYKDVVRLYDFFLASPKLMPLYVATSLVIQRRDEVLAVDCDMASIHYQLSRIPDDLDFEEILNRASILYEKYPPEQVEKDVKARVQQEYVFFSYSYIVHKLVMYIKALFSFRFIMHLCLNFSRKHKYK